MKPAKQNPSSEGGAFPHIIIGTSGHIDHGKSAVVKALTDTDPDRLKEEQERGMTIDLGYAFYDENTAFIDVPGHERFIKNMVAGVTTIDFVLLVVAADDGVMPQTREHLDILSLLGVESGIIVLNKTDLAEPDWIGLVEDDIKDLVQNTFLADAPIIRFSAKDLTGLEALRAEIDRMLQNPPQRFDRGFFWMPVDRSFTIQGFGTVVTGSVLSGELRRGEEVEILPGDRREKVRGLQRHGQDSQRIMIGDRGAINLQGVSRHEIARGHVVAAPGCAVGTKRLDVSLVLLKSAPKALKDQSRIRLHLGTSEILARVRLLDSRVLEPGQTGSAQLILEQPLAATSGDRFVIRSYSPALTIGGGVVASSVPVRRHKRFDDETVLHLEKMQSPDLKEKIMSYCQVRRGVVTEGELVVAMGVSSTRLHSPLEALLLRGDLMRMRRGQQNLYAASEIHKRVAADILEVLSGFHGRNPHIPGMGRAELISKIGTEADFALVEAALAELTASGQLVTHAEQLARSDFNAGLTPTEMDQYNNLLQKLESSGFVTPTVKEARAELSLDQGLMNRLMEYGQSKKELVILRNGLIYRTETLSQIKTLVRDWIQKHKSITAGQLRDLIQASRKFSIELLEYFDEAGFTIRDGDERTLNE